MNEEYAVEDLATALRGCIDLIEGWAYGPLFEKAGIQWPNGVCQAPALVKAKKLLQDLGNPGIRQ